MKLKSASYRLILVISLVALPLLSTHLATYAQVSSINSAKASAPVLANQSEAEPTWVTLTDTQKTALSPLANEWKHIDANRKQKWIEIANRYQKLGPAEKTRAQQRMHDWVKLTPEQRMRARENFARATKLKSDQKAAQWQHYQDLSAEEKAKLAADRQKKTVTNLPAAAVKLKPHKSPDQTQI